MVASDQVLAKTEAAKTKVSTPTNAYGVLLLVLVCDAFGTSLARTVA